MKRKHVATGKPKGGKREGSGRPEGSTNALALGEVAAVKAAGLRVPESATPAQRDLADRALQRIAAVMEEKVGAFASTAVLKASTHIREEICGALKQKVEHTFDGVTDEQLEARYRELVAKGTATATHAFPPQAGPTESAVPEGADLGLSGESE